MAFSAFSCFDRPWTMESEQSGDEWDLLGAQTTALEDGGYSKLSALLPKASAAQPGGPQGQPAEPAAEPAGEAVTIFRQLEELMDIPYVAARPAQAAGGHASRATLPRRKYKRRAQQEDGGHEFDEDQDYARVKGRWTKRPA